MSGIKLKAKRKNTDDWLLFGITELFHGENGSFQVCVEDVGLFAIDPATIRPADDPRKAMLENVRDRFLWLFGNNKTHSIISLVQVNSIIDEMEAKL